MLKAFKMRNATRNIRISCDTDTCLIRSIARLHNILASSELVALPRLTFVEACEMGVAGDDDMMFHLSPREEGLISRPGQGLGKKEAAPPDPTGTLLSKPKPHLDSPVLHISTLSCSAYQQNFEAK